MAKDKLAPSRQTAAKTVYAAFKILKKNGGHMPGREVIKNIRETVDFTDSEKEILEKSGYVRWEAILHFYTVDCSKAGFLLKKKGVWYLTEEGEKSIELGPEKILDIISKAYRTWQANHRNDSDRGILENPDNTDIDDIASQKPKANIDLLEEQALTGIKDFIKEKNAYEFQDLVAALLRAMGYQTPLSLQKGRMEGWT